MQSLNSISQESPEPVGRISPQTPEEPVWGFFDVILIAGFAFLSLVFLFTLTIALANASGRLRGVSPIKFAENTMVLVSTQAVGSLMTVVFMVQMLRVKYHVSFAKAVNWNWPRLRPALFVVAGGVALSILSTLASHLLERWIPKSLPIDELFRDTQSAYLLSFLGILVAPVVEELFFRGFLYPVLARATGVAAGVLLTAAAFALVHSGQLAQAWIPLMLIFVVGLALTMVRAKTKSVATTMLMHMSYNATLFTLAFIDTQGFRHLH